MRVSVLALALLLGSSGVVTAERPWTLPVSQMEAAKLPREEASWKDEARITHGDVYVVREVVSKVNESDRVGFSVVRLGYENRPGQSDLALVKPGTTIGQGYLVEVTQWRRCLWPSVPYTFTFVVKAKPPPKPK